MDRAILITFIAFYSFDWAYGAPASCEDRIRDILNPKSTFCQERRKDPNWSASRISSPPSKKSINDVAQLVRKLRQLLIEAIKTRDHNDEHSTFIKDSIKRLENLQLEFTPEYPCTIVANGSLPNLGASASANASAMTICDSAANIPPAELLTALAHELGHIVDPCKWSYLKINKTPEFEKLMAAGLPKACKKIFTTDEDVDIEIPLSALTESNSDGSALTYVKAGVGCGVFSVDPSSLQPFRFDDIWGGTVLQCLHKKKKNPFSSVHVPVRADSSTKSKGGTFNIAQSVEITKPSDFPGLIPGECTSQNGEAFADHVGFDLLNRYLERYGDSMSPEDRELVPRFLENLICLPEFYILLNGKPTTGYPPSEQRLRTLYSYPKIRELIGCANLDKQADCIEPEWVTNHHKSNGGQKAEATK